MLSVRVTSTRPTAYARSEANVEQIVDGLHEQAVRAFSYFVLIMLKYDAFKKTSSNLVQFLIQRLNGADM